MMITGFWKLGKELKKIKGLGKQSPKLLRVWSSPGLKHSTKIILPQQRGAGLGNRVWLTSTEILILLQERKTCHGEENPVLGRKTLSWEGKHHPGKENPHFGKENLLLGRKTSSWEGKPSFCERKPCPGKENLVLGRKTSSWEGKACPGKENLILETYWEPQAGEDISCPHAVGCLLNSSIEWHRGRNHLS